ncbi:hypothetical protein [Mycobacteroides abscessus]|uniref:hypothetical protein n=1 Tax=Mycobacteroides abscessus TaxID=36809 RepID=UPI0009A8F7D3|nr:hypothetical protein [Mycobacteroides abscessus]SKG09798.1 Uncharacterised protein [Mycobacteroides abscessus subsp. massiliense]SKG96205.1 Uncharacterised protein [Mycobacteroides abscessus subsp. massiliense]SKH76459.1 Uncharacterised protein [Mycobacteroides abscessus subsp. massiliense]SKI57958.1 Uncharacterised protein [Mycobacteroides abscessus subsp. massiliense]SKI70831.1 Uncharacterised protein [Mycobacteroides abscessus subsp. massiliense]
MTAIEPIYHFDPSGGQVTTAMRHFEALVEAITEECCQQVETTLFLCRAESGRRADADEFFAATQAQIRELRALMLYAVSDQRGVDSVLAR